MTRRSLRSWLWRVPVDQEVDEEIAFHIEMRTRELVERGIDPVGAREIVLGRIGDVNRLRSACMDIGRKRDRAMRLTQRIEEFATDVRIAIRQLRAAPGFTLVAVITLALGIGANSAMFALADAVLLRPLPFVNGDRLVLVAEHGPQQTGRSRIELLNLREWIASNRTFEAMAAIWIPAAGGGPTMVGPDGAPEVVPAQMVSAHLFEVLGVRPIAGRTFVPDDERRATPVVVISEGFWRRRFASDPELIGREILLEGRPATVIGIAPSTVRFAPSAGFDSAVVSPSIWTLLPQPGFGSADAARGQCGVCRFLQVVGQLKPGISIEAAQSDLTLIAESIAAQAGQPSLRRITVTSLREALTSRDLRRTSLLLLGINAFLFGVSPTDPVTFVAAATLLTITAAFAAAAPAWRAARVDPVVTFRAE